MPRKPFPPLGPTPTPITEYLANHPESTMMSLAKVSGLHYDTIHKAETGLAVPSFVTLLKLQHHIGIPVMAWAKTKAVEIQMERSVDPKSYGAKQERWRSKRKEKDPAFKEKENSRWVRRNSRLKAARHGDPQGGEPVRHNPLRERMMVP